MCTPFLHSPVEHHFQYEYEYSTFLVAGIRYSVVCSLQKLTFEITEYLVCSLGITLKFLIDITYNIFSATV